MWKAIGWGFGGLVLGLALGASLGAAAGAIVGTVAGSVLGALPPLLSWRRACKSPCRGCAAVCEPKRSVSLRAPLLAVGAAGCAVLAAHVAGLAAPFLLPVMAALVVLGVAVRVVLLRLSPVLQRTGRVSLHSGPLAHKLAAANTRPSRQRVVRPALARGPLALENKTITVTPDMFVEPVKEEAR